MAEHTKRLESEVHNNLAPALQNALDEHDLIHERIRDLQEPRDSLNLIRDEKLESIVAKVNLADEFYVDAHVTDTSRLYVDVGLGFNVEMTLDEALSFCDTRESKLTFTARALADEAAELKAKIKLIVGAIDELLVEGSE